MSNPIKELRKQLRPLVKEHLPEIITHELYEQILNQVHGRLDKIEEDQKRLMSYIMRLTAPKVDLKK